MNSANNADESLARQAQQGDREAFLILYNRYLNKVYNRVKTRVPQTDVEDVVQDIFIAVVRSLPSFELRAQFNTWLYTIVNRQIADYYRKQYRTVNKVDEHVTLEDADRKARTSTSEQDKVDLQTQLQAALNKIPAHYQEVITLRFVEQLSFQEIAERRNQTMEAVKSLFRRALQAVRDEVGDSFI